MAKDKALTIPFAGRTVERGRGCWNCIHWANDKRVRDHYLHLRAVEVAVGHVRLDTGITPEDALQAHQIGDEETVAKQALRRERARESAIDRMVNSGRIGICTAGKSPGNFVEFGYLCDNWTGTVGSSVATEGHKLDLLPEELKDKLGDK